jgi:hypothetical protein
VGSFIIRFGVAFRRLCGRSWETAWRKYRLRPAPAQSFPEPLQHVLHQKPEPQTPKTIYPNENISSDWIVIWYICRSFNFGCTFTSCCQNYDIMNICWLAVENHLKTGDTWGLAIADQWIFFWSQIRYQVVLATWPNCGSWSGAV